MASGARRVGLSKFQRTASLHPHLKRPGQEHHDRKPSKLQQPVQDDDAPPVSSDEEDEGAFPSSKTLSLKLNGSNRQSPGVGSEDSEPERSDRGNMKRTAFGKSSASKPQRTSTRYASQSKVKAETAEDTDAMSSSSNKRKREEDDNLAPAKGTASGSKIKSGSHLTTEIGFTKLSKAKTTYGSKSASSQGSRGSQLSQRSQESQFKKERVTSPSRKRTIRDAEGLESFNSPDKSTKAQFKGLPNDDSLDSPKKSQKASLKMLSQDSLNSPTKSSKAQMVVPTNELSPSPTKGSQIIKLSQEDDLSLRPSSSQQKKSIWNRGRIIAPKRKKKKASSPPQSPKPVFIAHLDDDDMFGNNADPKSSQISLDTDLSSDSEAHRDVSSDEDNEDDLKNPPNTLTQCPWCGDLVPESALKEYSKGKRLNVQMQTRFCRKHKKETAMDTWRERGYPHVDWRNLEGRFDDHRQYLSRVIDGKPSHFRDILAEKIETGQGRSLKKEGNLNPGYYGPRGCKIMCDYLVEEFGELLKEKAVDDRVIAGRGSAAFIQSVLVAELAVQLIMEDMGVSAAEARDIMEESKAVGEMVHEEV
ncbi:hypothetical protein FALBO_6512 [Fusarium albosuccineum]|uniref:Restriction of telomere capping protein 4 n=1 Tax=Fusarium albosuccineum TaxID=1237068 RepID=A0A8H4LFB6_9HYPO|nr:hypothetical protein FALBO_6512 [Fusarium albosuccineum]